LGKNKPCKKEEVNGKHRQPTWVSQDVGIISRGQYLCIFAAVARVDKASLPPPREAAGCANMADSDWGKSLKT